MAILKDTKINGDCTVIGNLEASTIKAGAVQFEDVDATFRNINVSETLTYGSSQINVGNEITQIKARLDGLGFKRATINVLNADYIGLDSSSVCTLGKVFYGQLNLKYPQISSGSNRPQSVKIAELSNLNFDNLQNFSSYTIAQCTNQYTYGQTTVTYTATFQIQKVDNTKANVVVNFPTTINGAGYASRNYIIPFWYDDINKSYIQNFYQVK